MRIIIDTCVISELRRQDCHASVRKLIDETPSDRIFISVITLGELAKGIAGMEPGKRKSELQSWLRGIENNYSDRIIPIDGETARIWGEITAKAQKNGTPLPACDGLIAASALRHGLTVVTRNTSDFEPSGALILNPWINA